MQDDLSSHIVNSSSHKIMSLHVSNKQDEETHYRHYTAARFIFRKYEFSKTTTWTTAYRGECENWTGKKRTKSTGKTSQDLIYLPKKRMSFAIFIREVATVFSEPLDSTKASCAAYQNEHGKNIF